MTTISLCMTCMNRLWQIKQTLHKNIENCKKFGKNIEIILVNFNSKDNLHQWIITNFLREIKDGLLKYYYTKQPDFWHASIAKNTSHFLGSGNILINLDCDNIISLKEIIFINNYFFKYHIKNIHLLHLENKFTDKFGRIVISKDFFRYIGGYNEHFLPQTIQDENLIFRYIKTGNVYKNKVFNISKNIENSCSQSIKNTYYYLSNYQYINHFIWYIMATVNFVKNYIGIFYSPIMKTYHIKYIDHYHFDNKILTNKIVKINHTNKYMKFNYNSVLYTFCYCLYLRLYWTVNTIIYYFIVDTF
jgi:hypothetical protein